MRQVQMGNALKNDEWIDADDIELKSLPELPGFHVLIKPVSVKSKQKEVYLYQILPRMILVISQQ